MSSTLLVRSISLASRRKALRMMGSTNSGSSGASSVKQKHNVDEEGDDEEDEGKAKPPAVIDPAKVPHTRSPTGFTPYTRVTPQREYSPTELSFSDDVLSSLTRSFENRSMEDQQEQPGTFRMFLDWSVDPDGMAAFYWKAAVTIAIMYNCAVIILRTAFAEMRGQEVFTVLDIVSDAVYILDIVFESKTSFLKDGCMVKDAKQTFQHYRGKQQFIYDVISVFPTNTVVVQVAHLCDIFQLADSKVLTFWKYFHVYESVLRLNRLLKCHAMDTFFQRTESRTNNPNLLRACKLSLHLGLVIHWIACLYYMLSEFEGVGTNDWVYPLEPDVTRFSRKYILCMFWSTMTLTTIGERPSPVTEQEYIFTGFTFLVGVFVFAAVVGNVGDVISNLNAARRDFQARMDQIKFYMNHRNVPEDLQNRIKRWAEYTWDRTKAIDEPSAMQFLPDRLRTEVAIHVHLNILKKVSIFDECEEGLLRELVLKLRPQIFSPGDYICRIGEIGREMFIINHGKVEILFPDFETGDMIQVAIMHPGNFFGEISLLKLDDGQNRRTADVRSVGFSELLCLSRRDLIMALAEYPEAKKVLEDYARQRFNNTKKLTPPDTEDSRNVSPRVSCVCTHNKRTARQIFSQAMKREGFTKLLASATKNAELMEIKAAVEELRVTKNLQMEESLLCMQKKVQELERMVLDKNLELQESQAHVSYLEKVITKLSPGETKPKLSSSEVDIDFLNQEYTMSHDMQESKLVPSDRSSVGSYISKQDLEKPLENLDETLNNFCALRRNSFQTTVQKNISSTEILSGSSSTDSLIDSLGSDLYGDIYNTGDTKTVSVGCEVPPYSFTTSRSQRRASAPYTASNVDHILKSYIRRSATVYNPGISDLHSSTSLPNPLKNLSELENSSIIIPKKYSTNAQNRCTDRKMGSPCRKNNSSNTICSLKNKSLHVAPVCSVSSTTRCSLTNGGCSLRCKIDDDTNLLWSNSAAYGAGKSYLFTHSLAKNVWENTKKRPNDNTFITLSKKGQS